MRLDEAGLGRWGRRIGEEVDTPVFIALSGPLGAGKSVLARAIGAGAGVVKVMPSPSFNLLFRYRTSSGTNLVHVDLYRLSSPEEVWEIGWAQLGDEGDLVLVEWPQRAADLLPPDRWSIELSVPDGHPEIRDVAVHRVGSPPALPGFPIAVSAP